MIKFIILFLIGLENIIAYRNFFYQRFISFDLNCASKDDENIKIEEAYMKLGKYDISLKV